MRATASLVNLLSRLHTVASFITCIGVANDVGVCGVSDGLDERTHLGGSEGAVQTNAAKILHIQVSNATM